MTHSAARLSCRERLYRRASDVPRLTNRRGCYRVAIDASVSSLLTTGRRSSQSSHREQVSTALNASAGACFHWFMRSSFLCITVQSLAVGACLSGCASGDEGANADPVPDPPAAADAEARVPDDWATFEDSASGVSFRYPHDLGTTYIQALDWPPRPLVEAGPFECTEAGEETARAGRTELATIGGRSYCVTRVTEGAAGSIYTMYAYALPAGDDVVILTFSTRAPQCGNYDEPRRDECEREREAFSMDPIVDAIARTLRVAGSPLTRD